MLIGTILSITLFFIIIYIIILGLIKLLSKDYVTWTTNSNHVNLANDNTVIKLDKEFPKLMMNYRFRPQSGFPEEINMTEYQKYVSILHGNYKFEGKLFTNGNKAFNSFDDSNHTKNQFYN